MVFNSLPNRFKNTITFKELKEKIFFLHVYKSGGTSIDKAIKSCYQAMDIRKDRSLIRMDSRGAAKVGSILYGLDYTYGTNNDFKILNFEAEYLAYCMYKGYKYISGHISFNVQVYEEFKKEYKFITVLRDPVKRWISAYFFFKYRKKDRLIIDSEIMDYLRSDLGKGQGYEYVKYLGGAREDSDYTSRNAIENAKKNLLKFDLVGCMEDLDCFVKTFKKQFGICLKVKRLNPSPVSESFRRNFITQEIEEKIKEVCKPDIEIYKYAIDNFIKHTNNH